MHSVSPLYAAAELKAHEQRSNHAFVEAAGSAEKAAEIALNAGDSISWWNMSFLQAENLLDAGLFAECATLAQALLTDTLGQTNGRDVALTHILLAKALQGSGLLEQAAASARAAGSLTDN